jgi:hypothetical protein
MAPIQSYAQEIQSSGFLKAGFVEVKPMTRLTAIKNGGTVHFSAKLMAAPVQTSNRPVSGVMLDVYILRSGKKKEKEKVGRVTTNARGEFIVPKRVFLSPEELNKGVASIPWFVEVIKAPKGVIINGTNENLIGGWGFRVVP